MRYVLILILALCCGVAQAATKSKHGSRQKATQAQKVVAKDAHRDAAVMKFQAQVDEANRLARLKAVKENTPLIHGWAVRVGKDGKPSKVSQTWPNPSYRK